MKIRPHAPLLAMVTLTAPIERCREYAIEIVVYGEERYAIPQGWYRFGILVRHEYITSR